MTTWKWYITISAVRQYMEIAGLRGELEDTNLDFLAAQEALGRWSREARLVRGKDVHGALVYRTGKIKLTGRTTRLQFLVQPIPRVEGALPQLVSVRTR